MPEVCAMAKTSIQFANETSIRVFDKDIYEDLTGSPTKADDGPNTLSALMGQIMLSFKWGVIKDSKTLRMYYSDKVIANLYEAISSEIDTLITRLSGGDQKIISMYYKGSRLIKTDTIVEELEKLKKIFRLAKLEIYLGKLEKMKNK